MTGFVQLAEAEQRGDVPSECGTSPEPWENIALEFPKLPVENMVYVRKLGRCDGFNGGM